MTEPWRGTEQVAGGTRVHQQPLVGGGTQGAAHAGQTADELRHGQLELTDQDTPCRRNGKADAVRTGRQRESQIGDQQRLAYFGFAADEQNALRRQQCRFHQARRSRGGLLLQQLTQREHRRGGSRCSLHNSASCVASSRIDSSTIAALRAAARRNAAKASLLTLRRMPLVA